MTSRGSLPEPAAGHAPDDDVPMKLEMVVEDPLEEEHGPISKRARACHGVEQEEGTQLGAAANAFPIPPSQYNPLDEPSPLGLRLKKSPSLLDLIQMTLSQGTHPVLEVVSYEDHGKEPNKDNRSSAACGSTAADKIKASNFTASLLKIGEWKYESKYEGDLIAKCYFAKRKLVWEILERGLKSKIEIQWSDIVALKAVFPDDGPGELNIVLSKKPLFFRESNPQPRKHTLWQATSDFTDGQASTHRQHILECPPELLKKNFEKLIQCDVRLNHLSQLGKMVVETPVFETKPPVFGELDESKSFGKVENSNGSIICGVKELSSAQLPPLRVELSDSVSAAPQSRFEDAPSPGSDARATEVSVSSKAVDTMRAGTKEQVKLPGLCKSMSVTDLVNHIGQCIAENMESSTFAPDDKSQGGETFEDIAQYFLSDAHFTTVSDEKSLISRVNSLCCLLEVDPQATIQGLQTGDEVETTGGGDGKGLDGAAKETPICDATDQSAGSRSITMEVKAPEGDPEHVSPSSKQQVGLSRKDSFSDLLFQLPWIDSLPKFLFDISEEDL